MSQSFVDEQKAEIIAGLSALYRPGQLHKAGSRVSDGRGGFTGTATPYTVQVQREDLTESLVKRNIAPDGAMVFVLNDGTATPEKGDALTVDAKTFLVLQVDLDPAGAVFECVCESG